MRRRLAVIFAVGSVVLAAVGIGIFAGVGLLYAFGLPSEAAERAALGSVSLAILGLGGVLVAMVVALWESK